MNLICYPLLQKNSKLAIRRKKWRWGRNYFYNPRIDLLERLAYQLGWTEEQVREQLMREREFLLKYPQYF